MSRNKLFDVYEHKPIKHDHPLLKGVDGELKACISRQTKLQIRKYWSIQMLS